MNILGIDTSLARYIIAISHDNGLASRAASISKSKINLLPSMVNECLSESHLSLQDIDHFGVVLGPGSFTGLRMGCAFIQGLSYACAKPAVGLSNLALIAKSAQKISEAKELLVALKVSQLGYYIGHFVQQTCRREQFSETLPEMAEGVAKIGDVEGFLHVEKSPEALLTLAREQIEAQRFLEAQEVVPHYLYQPIYRKVGNFNG